MNVLVVHKNKFYIYDNTVCSRSVKNVVENQEQAEAYELNDLFTEELYEFCNGQVKKYENTLTVVNEIYLNSIQPVQAICLFLKKNEIRVIRFKNPERTLFSMFMDASSICKIKTRGMPVFYKWQIKMRGYLNTCLAAGYLFWKQLQYDHSDKSATGCKRFSVIRTPAAKKKMEFLILEEDFSVKYENFSHKKTIYHCFRRRQRLKWVLLSWFNSYKELKTIECCVGKMAGKFSAVESYYYYSRRMAHTLLYQYMLKEYFHKNAGKIFYTGNNLDRFSVIEEKLAKKYKIKIICIPHGLEYGFKLPHCFVGDIFYATSQKAATYLNYLYHTTKFVYDSNMTKKMFSVNYNVEKMKKIVFFTEPREVFVNIKIIEELIPLLEKENMKLSIKLHPKDQKSDYIEYEKRVDFIKDFNESISNNICFSRKSTTLIEAVYNGSQAAAILTNSKDKAVFWNFPSLQDERIKVFYDIPQLFQWIQHEWEKE